jgi:hypothetical protein
MEGKMLQRIGNTPGWIEWLTGSTSTASQQAALSLPPTNYKAIPDYDSWDLGDSTWTCENWKSWHASMNKYWGTRAANLKFVACWNAKPFTLTPCGNNADFYTYFDGVNLDLRSAQAQANGYINTVSSLIPSVDKLIFGGVVIGGIYAASRFIDFGIQKQKATFTPKKLAIGAGVLLAGYFGFEAWYKGGKYAAYESGTNPNSYSGVPLYLYLEKMNEIQINTGTNFSVSAPPQIEAYWNAKRAQTGESLNAFALKEVNSLKDFLLLPPGASWA